jgi:Putative antitoxin of bacterial toxin-antitoxin system, YdaS/YdaT
MKLSEYAAETGIRPVDFHRRLREEHGVVRDEETVRRWLNGTLQPAARWMRVIEAATEGKVSRHDMWPEIFGPRPERGRAA